MTLTFPYLRVQYPAFLCYSVRAKGEQKVNISRKKPTQKSSSYGRIFSFEDAVRGNVYFQRVVPAQGMQWRDDLIPSIWGEDAEPNSRDNTRPPYLVKNKSQFSRACLPFKDIDLLRKFLRLTQSPTREAIKKFASRYGFLGHPVTLRDPAIDTTKLLTNILSGESLNFWQEEVHRLAALWNRWEMVTGQDKYALSQYVKWTDNDGCIDLEINDGTTIHTISVRQSDIDIGGEIKDGTYSKIRVGDVVTAMRVCIEQQINERLRGHVHLVVFHFIDTNLHMAPDCLLSGLYLLFAFEIVGERLNKNPHKACRGCDNHFAPTRPNQLYCNKNCKARTNRRLQRARLKKELSRKKKSLKAK